MTATVLPEAASPPASATDLPIDARRNSTAGLLRRLVFWMHLALGVTGGAVILVMAVTGVLLAYERQVTDWLDGPAALTPAPGATALALEPLLARVAATGAPIGSVQVNRDPAVPLSVRRRDRSTVFVDPYTGATVPTGGHPGVREFFSSVETWHRWLGGGFGGDRSRREIGETLTGASNLAFLVIVISGFFLWWPRRWTRRALRASAVVNVRLSGRARDWNWHNAIGVWSAPVLVLVVTAGVFMSYRWPRRLLDRVAGSASEQAAARQPEPDREGPPRQGAAGARGARGGNPAAGEATGAGSIGIDSLVAIGRARVPGWRTVTVNIPAPGEGTARVSVSAGNTFRPDLRTQLTVDGATGAIRSVQTYDSLSTSRRLQGWVRGGHTGEVFGVVGQTLAMLASAGAVVLVMTGIMLAIRRLWAWRRRRAFAAA